MNARTVAAMNEFDAILGSEQYEHGYLVTLYQEGDPPWQRFFLTHGEAKTCFFKQGLVAEDQLLILDEVEARFEEDGMGGRYHVRSFEELDRRVASALDIAWQLAEIEEHAQRGCPRWYHVNNWLYGQTPAPTWA